MLEEIDEAAFARVVAIRAGQLAWLLGAGASASAGVPTAGQMILDFKAALFASAQRLKRGDIDMDDPVWFDRVERYFDAANGFPFRGDPREYETSFTLMYPSAEDRRRYIAAMMERGTPSYGQRVLAALTVLGRVPIVFTTNFDALLETAAGSVIDLLEPSVRRPLRVSALSDSDIAERSLRQSDWPLLVKLHGDYRSDALKNTSDELRQQDRALRLVLTESGRRFGLIVAGYSGRDESVMDALNEVLDGPTPFPNGLFWIARSGETLLPHVRGFLDSASAAGVEVRLVQSETFDELLGEIGRQTALPPIVDAYLDARRTQERLIEVRLPKTEIGKFPALRFNALPVLAMPDTAMHAASSVGDVEFRAVLRERRARVEAVANGAEIVALGDEDEFTAAVNEVGSDVPVERRPLRPEDDTVAHGLLLDALTRALAFDRPLRSRIGREGASLRLRSPSTDSSRDAPADHRLAPMRAVYGNDLFGHVEAIDGRAYAEAVRLRLEHRLDRWWLLFEPFTWTERAAGREVPDPFAAWIRQRWFGRRNREWSAMVGAWAKLLAPRPETSVPWPPSGEAGFVLGQTTAWSAPGAR